MSGSSGPEVAPPEASPAPPAAGDRLKTLHGAGLFLLLAAVYHLNFDFNPASDSIPNLFLASNLVTRGSLSFSPEELPFMFAWRLKTSAGDRIFKPASWESTVQGRTALELYREGRLEPFSAKYYLVPSTEPGRYVGIYGPGAGLLALPVLGPVALIPGARNFGALGYAGKSLASLLVAGSAVFVCLAALRFVPSRQALALGLVYGLGTCVWSESSQALWQQTPALFFVAWGTYLLVRVRETSRASWMCGLAYGAAVVCRPTLALLFLGVLVYLVIEARPASLRYLSAGIWPILLLLAYNAHYLGTPFRTGQAEAAAAVARTLTGSEDLWQTPLWLGAAGVLLSPSRGLLVYSPFLALSFWGAVRAWRSSAPPPERVFRALGPAAAGLLLVAFKWFSWWGGATYGYRVIVELTPLFVALLVPLGPVFSASRPLRMAFLALVGWSVGVQALGAFAYSQSTWNARARYEVELPGRSETITLGDAREVAELVRTGHGRVVRETRLNVDLPENRSRLWSIADAQILFYLHPAGLSEGRRDRWRDIRESFGLR
jgi:hypothetical protein